MPVNLDQKLTPNPYRTSDWIGSHASFSSSDPWAEDRAKAPGLTTGDVDYLMRQAFAQGRQSAFVEAQERHGGIWDEGYRQGRHDGQVEAVDALKGYETNAVFNTLLDLIDRRGLAPKTTIKAEREFMKDLERRLGKVVDDMDEWRRTYGA